MFKALTPYLVNATPAAEHCVALPEFVPCTPSQAQSLGFVPPRAGSDELREAVAGHTVLSVCIERKTVPGDMLRREVEKAARAVEDQTGRKPGKKALADLKEQVTHELMPRAFPKRKNVPVLFLANSNLLLVGSTSAADTDAIVTLLVRVFDGLTVSSLMTALAPTAVLNAWLLDGQPSEGFAIGRKTKLESDAGKVAFDDHALDTEAVKDHLRAGKYVVELALAHRDRLGFVLTDGLQMKSLALLDLAQEGREQSADAFDADVAIWGGELHGGLGDLVASMGGLNAA